MIFLSIILIIHQDLSAQSSRKGSYQLNEHYDKNILIPVAVAYLGGLYMKETIRPLSASEIAAIHPNRLNAWDRSGLGGNSVEARKRSDVLLRISLASPFFLALDKRVREDYLVHAVMFAEVILFNNAIADWSKGLSRKPRPYVYDPEKGYIVKSGKSAVHSFFSGHASTTAAYGFFAAHMVSHYSDSKALKIGSWFVATTLPAYTGYLRVKAGKHFPTDVAAGYLIGAAIGYGVPHWHLKKRDKATSFSIGPSADGLSLSYKF